MTQNIQDEHWAQCIQDYKKVRTLFGETQISVFSKVLGQIEKVADSLRAILYARLEAMPAPLQEQVRVIGFLTDLGATPDPAKFCLERQKEFVVSQLKAAEDTLAESIEVMGSGQSRSKLKWGKLRMALKVSRSILPSDSEEPSKHDDERVFTRLKQVEGTKAVLSTMHRRSPHLTFVEHMSKTLSEHLPSMWKLGQLCLHRANPELRKDSLSRIDAYNMDDDDDEGGGETKQLILQIERLVTTVMEDYVIKCRSAFFDQAQKGSSAIPIDSLTQSEAQIRGCHTTLTALELPVATLSSLTDLLVDFRRHTINQLFQEATKTISTLALKETWKMMENGMRTMLPEHLSTILQLTFTAVRDMKLNVITTDTLEDGEAMLCETLDAFTTCMNRLAFEDEKAAAEAAKTTSSPPRANVSVTSAAISTPAAVAAASQTTQRMLCVMANCLYTRRVLARQIADQFISLNLGSLTGTFQDTLVELDDLDHRCFDALIRLKTEELSVLLQQCVAGNDFDSVSADPERMQLRPYARRTLLALVTTHAEAHANARPYLHRIISTLVSIIAKTMNELVSVTTDFGRDARGVLQLRLEVFAMRMTLKNYDQLPSVWDAVLVTLNGKSSAKGQTRRALPTPGGTPGKRSLPTPGGVRRPTEPDLGGGDDPSSTSASSGGPFEAPEAVRSALQRFQQSNQFQLACFRTPPEQEDSFFRLPEIIKPEVIYSQDSEEPAPAPAPSRSAGARGQPAPPAADAKKPARTMPKPPGAAAAAPPSAAAPGTRKLPVVADTKRKLPTPAAASAAPVSRTGSAGSAGRPAPQKVRAPVPGSRSAGRAKLEDVEDAEDDDDDDMV